MAQINSQYWLRSSAFERSEEENLVEPKKVVFLSVEGDETERTYFTHLNETLDSSIIHIEVLRHRRGDGYSDPIHVIELLQEFLDMRQGPLIPNEILNEVITKYSDETIQTYIATPDKLDQRLKNNIQSDLLLLGIDVEYRRYLQKYDKATDIFGVVLDRDCGSHSREVMENSIKYCQKNGVYCYISNPCFEFWLLLHLCDVMTEFGDAERKQLLLNPKISDRHTQVSFEVSKRAHHSKKIPQTVFMAKYHPNIEIAIVRSSNFALHFPELLDKLGTNIPELLELIGFPPT